MNQKIGLTRQILAAVLILSSASVFVSCEKYAYDPPKIDLTTPVSFKNEIFPIFNSNCKGCHSGGKLDFNSLASTWTSINKTTYITAGNPESSLIYTKLNESSHSTKCSTEERNKIYVWITQGALNDNE
ncbi:MAG: hypothetical protein EHM93_08495 [Bacteroidales bacterium]|nr:MAG: hypothetical protein EHM93_08495 [Bacteroidales bacterium]